MEKKKKPKFNVPNLGFFKSVKARWRKPRGTHNKKRMKAKFMGALPKVGYRNQHEIRGLHSSGSKEVLVNNLQELVGLKNVVVRVASGVGAKKRKIIAEKAHSMKLRIVNMAVAGASKFTPKPKTTGPKKVGSSKSNKVSSPASSNGASVLKK